MNRLVVVVVVVVEGDYRADVGVGPENAEDAV